MTCLTYLIYATYPTYLAYATYATFLPDLTRPSYPTYPTYATYPPLLARALLTRAPAGKPDKTHFHGMTDTWMAPGAPCPPTDLMA